MSTPERETELMATPAPALSSPASEGSSPGEASGSPAGRPLSSRRRTTSAAVPLREAPTFFPEEEEFADFAGYLNSIASRCSEYGLCKIVPPASWASPKTSRAMLNSVEIRPIEQHAHGCGGIYSIANAEQPRMSVERLRKLAPVVDARLSEDECMARFWSEISAGVKPAWYGADVGGSFFPSLETQPHWNLLHLPDLLRTEPTRLQESMCGINSPMLYFGCWRSLFALHTEDMDLMSINFLHSGAPKQWYGIPSTSADHVELLAAQCVSQPRPSCSAPLRHKDTLIAPEVFTANSVPLCSLRQRAGEFVVTWPRAYHFGFNMGTNCAESTNFALPMWLPAGLTAVCCNCPIGKDLAYISMASFMRALKSSIPVAQYEELQSLYQERREEEANNSEADSHEGDRDQASAVSIGPKKRKRSSTASRDGAVNGILESSSGGPQGCGAIAQDVPQPVSATPPSKASPSSSGANSRRSAQDDSDRFVPVHILNAKPMLDTIPFLDHWRGCSMYKQRVHGTQQRLCEDREEVGEGSHADTSFEEPDEEESKDKDEAEQASVGAVDLELDAASAQAQRGENQVRSRIPSKKAMLHKGTASSRSRTCNSSRRCSTSTKKSNVERQHEQQQVATPEGTPEATTGASTERDGIGRPCNRTPRRAKALTAAFFAGVAGASAREQDDLRMALLVSMMSEPESQGGDS